MTSLRVFRFFGLVQETHVKAANVVHIVFDVVGRAACCTLALEYLVGSVGTHVAIDIELVIANCTAFVACPTKFLIVSKGTLGTFAGHQG